MKPILKPRKLHPGDTIGIVSPAWGGAHQFPHRITRGIQYLESQGYQVAVGHYALNSNGYVSDSPEHRAEDINRFFEDDRISAIISTIGGDHSCQVLPYLDFVLIQKNPKIFMGYSDITVLNNAIWQMTGLVTFNGPAIMTDFAEYPAMDDYTARHVFHILTDTKQPMVYRPSTWWSEEYLEWGIKADLQRPRARIETSGWHWLKPGYGEGRLVGGCIESLQHLRGTPYWPDIDQAILFLETSEEKPSPAWVAAVLSDYKNMKVLENIQGLLIGRCYHYTPEETGQLEEILVEQTAQFDFPIITHMDFGHTIPQITLPIGCKARIDTDRQSFQLLEPAVSE